MTTALLKCRENRRYIGSGTHNFAHRFAGTEQAGDIGVENVTDCSLSRRRSCGRLVCACHHREAAAPDAGHLGCNVIGKRGSDSHQWERETQG
jgi:hypothetical protein